MTLQWNSKIQAEDRTRLANAVASAIDLYRSTGSICSVQQITLVISDGGKFAALLTQSSAVVVIEAAMVEVFERDARIGRTPRFSEIAKAHYSSRRWRYGE